MGSEMVVAKSFKRWRRGTGTGTRTETGKDGMGDTGVGAGWLPGLMPTSKVN